MHGDGKPSVPRVEVPRGKPLPGEWLWTTRAGSEQDVVDEFTLGFGPDKAKVLGPALVRSRGAPTSREGGVDLTFARQGFRIVAEPAGTLDAMARGAARALAPQLAGDAPWTLSAWVPDADGSNPLGPVAEALEARTVALLDEDDAMRARRVPLAALPRSGALLAQLALAGPERAFAGLVRSEDALSLAPGGRARMRVGGERPSRAARKVEEALAWLGMAPGAGETCVDLGAAPGGWSWALLDRRAKVIAVDPAELRPDIARHRSMVHHKENAFQFVPEEPVDWLFCDMAWRPLEVAQLLAKWGRRRWTRLVVANLKLPMKTKAATVHDLVQVLAGGGWQQIRTRQLYHDRDEITLTAHL